MLGGHLGEQGADQSDVFGGVVVEDVVVTEVAEGWWRGREGGREGEGGRGEGREGGREGGRGRKRGREGGREGECELASMTLCK